MGDAAGDVLLTTREVLESIGLRRTWLKAAVHDGRFPRHVEWPERCAQL